MKLKLGAKEIEFGRISKVIKVSDSVAEIRMITGESIQVVCNNKGLTKNLICYQGSVEDLKQAVNEYQRIDEGF